jgi:hypothetical protein
VRHDDGEWYVAELLDQHRSGGRWRAVVRYTVAPGMRYVRGCGRMSCDGPTRAGPSERYDVAKLNWFTIAA